MQLLATEWISTEKVLVERTSKMATLACILILSRPHPLLFPCTGFQGKSAVSDVPPLLLALLLSSVSSLDPPF